MQSFTVRMLASASVAVIATFGLAGAASAQSTEPAVTATEADNCAKLATQPERDACIAGQAQDDRGAEETGSADTIPPEERAEQAADSGQAIVVTGSRLRRNVFTSPDPITVIDPEVSLQEGDVTVAEILQSTPAASGSTQITSFLSSNFVFNGGQGIETLSLRGLGAERTLVLLDGRRAGPAGTRGAVAAFDLNVLPSSIVRTVEVLKTGASSVYGSDAIAGVVNILTKRDTDGIELRAFASQPQESGGEQYDVSATWGKEFGRGHILLTGSYYLSEELERRDRDYLGCSEDYTFNEAGQRADIIDPRYGEPWCNDTTEAWIGVTNYSAALGGGNNLAPPPGSVVGVTSINLIQYNYPGSQIDTYGFALRPAANGLQFVAPAGFYALNFNNNSIAVMRSYRESAIQQGTTVLPRNERITAFASGSYELTDNVEVFADLLYNNRKTQNDATRAIFPQQFTRTSPTPLSQFAGFCPRLANGTDDPNDFCFPGDAGDPINVGFSGAQLLQPVTYVPAIYKQEINYYRGVVGARGELSLLGKPWNWDAWGQYSLSDGDYGNTVIFQDSFDVANFRTRSCVGTTTRIRGVPCIDINYTDPRFLAGNLNQAEMDFLMGYEVGNTKYRQLTGEASIQGDLIDLWAGPLQAALGVHVRRDSIKDVPGPVTQAGNSYGLSRAGVTAGHTITSEAFGEFDLPLFRDRPLVGSGAINFAARLTNYYAERDDGLSDKDNWNWTYKIAGNWSPNSWLRFRGSYGTSYRAPALFEQFLNNQTSFLGQTTIDPCLNLGTRIAAGTVAANVVANCQADGVPLTWNGTPSSSALIYATGGIGDLDPETSRALTASIILTPPPIWDGMRISFAADYFSIKVKGEIVGLGAGNILASCYTSETFPNDPVCDLFERVNDTTNVRDNQIITVFNPYLNINKQLNRGIDFTLRFSQDFGNLGNFAFLGQTTYQIEDTFELFAGAGVNNNGEVGDPKWVGDLNFTWQKDPVTFNWNVDYVGATSDRRDVRALLGSSLCYNSATRGRVCPDYRLERTFYHAVSATVKAFDKFDVTLGVDNLFDTAPPRTTQNGLNSASGGNQGAITLLGTQYPLRGRRFFGVVRARF
jgi:iron complex outermembrane receptor protein